jgi:uncharacterized protein YecE (DUF72 family)
VAEPKEIRLGTSGYSFLDWVGPFYPEGIPKGNMLDFYVKSFDTVEINSSYYSIPHFKVFENMEKKTPPGFVFMVKGHKSLTHERSDVLGPVNQFVESIRPLRAAGKLKGVLLQFPYSFRWSQKNQTYILRVRDLLDGFDVYIEFRHRGWIRDDILLQLEQHKLSVCSVDCPQLDSLPRPLLLQSSKNVYVRLHGRNAEHWWKGGSLRYDYLYSEKQLTDWISKIRDSKRPIQNAYLFFNNCHLGQAVQNAKMMMGLLGLGSDAERSGS